VVAGNGASVSGENRKQIQKGAAPPRDFQAFGGSAMSEATRIFSENDLICCYTRKQAIEDGILIEAGEIARQAGIKYHVALTSALWDGYIKPDTESEEAGQSIEGRLWDLLCLFRHHARRSSSSLLSFKVIFLMKGKEHRHVLVKAVCGPGDNAEPVITIMMPDED
jgi:hypothetical protein